MENYKNILVIKLGALGDFIQLTGWYAAIRHRWPKARITLMTNRSFFKLAEQSGYFDHLIEDNRTWNPLDYIRIIHQLVTSHFDLIIDLQMQSRTQKRYYSLARFFSRQALSWSIPKDGYLLIRYTPAKWPFCWGKEEIQKIDFFPEPASLSFCKADQKVLEILPPKYVLLIPGCSPTHPYKRWPAASYRALAEHLAKQGVFSVVLGTNAEKTEIEAICLNNDKAVNFCNKSKLLDIPEIAANALAVVGNDTGPQHMAELGTVPIITLFCEKTKNSAVIRNNVTNLIQPNIEDISVETVYETLQSLWHKA